MRDTSFQETPGRAHWFGCCLVRTWVQVKRATAARYRKCRHTTFCDRVSESCLLSGWISEREGLAYSFTVLAAFLLPAIAAMLAIIIMRRKR